MTGIQGWATKWGVPYQCVYDLMQTLGIGYTAPLAGDTEGMSEAAVQSRYRLKAAQEGITLWRNNVGAYQDDTGRWVRYGLCNDSKKLNASIASADLIGIKPVLITQEMVGTVIGQFVSRECKEQGWVFTNEAAQLKWLELIISKGGDATFTTGD